MIFNKLVQLSAYIIKKKIILIKNVLQIVKKISFMNQLLISVILNAQINIIEIIRHIYALNNAHKINLKIN